MYLSVKLTPLFLLAPLLLANPLPQDVHQKREATSLDQEPQADGAPLEAAILYSRDTTYDDTGSPGQASNPSGGQSSTTSIQSTGNHVTAQPLITNASSHSPYNHGLVGRSLNLWTVAKRTLGLQSRQTQEVPEGGIKPIDNTKVDAQPLITHDSFEGSEGTTSDGAFGKE